MIANDEHNDCLEEIRHKDVYVGRCVYMQILEEIGIANEFMKIVNKMKWGKLFFNKYDAYKNLV